MDEQMAIIEGQEQKVIPYIIGGLVTHMGNPFWMVVIQIKIKLKQMHLKPW